MSHVFNAVKRDFPRFNPRIVEGIPVRELANPMAYIDRIFQIVAKIFPEGLTYHGLERVHPKEAYEVLTKKGGKNSSNKATYDLSQTNMYLVKVDLRWKGKPIVPKYLSMPYVGQAGTINIRGPLYTISPVLADKVISVSKDSVFIPFIRDRVTFYRLQHQMLTNGEWEPVPLVWSNIHCYSPGPKKATAPKNTLPHYLFCECGLQGAFQKYAGHDVVVGYDEINKENYKPGEWDIFESCKVPVNKADRRFVASNIKLAVRSNQVNKTTKTLAGAFFYLVDVFPDRIQPEYCSNRSLWRVLLGLMWVDCKDRNEGKLLNDVDTHMHSIEQYVDDIVREDLRKAKIPCETFGELFVYLCSEMPKYVSNTNLSSLFGKRLMVTRYVMLDYTKKLFKFAYMLKQNVKKELTERDINRYAGKHINPNIIFTLTKGHGEVNIIHSPNDNPLLKMNTKLVNQAEATSRRNSKKSGECPTRHPDASIFVVSSKHHVTKSKPDMRAALNPYAPLARDLSIADHPKFRALIDKTQAIIKKNVG